MGRRKYNDETYSAIKILRDMGLKNREIAEKLNLPKYTVEYIIFTHSVSKSWTYGEDELLIKLYNENMPYYKLNTHFPNRSYNAIQMRLYTLRKQGVITRRTKSRGDVSCEKSGS